MAAQKVEGWLYERVAPLFARRQADAVDAQTDFAERLDLITSVLGEKPSFFAMVGDPGRRETFEAVATVLGEVDAVPDLQWGWAEADVHVRHRPLRLAVPDLQSVVESRSRRLKLFWVTREAELADAYRSDALDAYDETRLLGYPPCCSAWHYDAFFARPVEAMVEVYRRPEFVGRMREHLASSTFAPGEFFPQDLFRAAIFRSNAAMPFISHVACPKCLGDPEGASFRQNAQLHALGLRLDPDLHARVADETKAAGVRALRLVSRPRRHLEDDATRLKLTEPCAIPTLG